jgi:hypothetical protein
MSASTSQRRSTVHDLATLRLHPDGKRVSITSPPRVGLNTSRRHNVGYDTRGNRNARDAAGVGLVPKRPVIQEDEGGKRQRRKRRRIDNEVEFLANSERGVLRTSDDADLIGSEGMSWPPPSSVRSFHLFFFFVFEHTSFFSYSGVSGPAEMRALLCKPILRRSGLIVES